MPSSWPASRLSRAASSRRTGLPRATMSERLPDRLWERGPDGEIRRLPLGGPGGSSQAAGLTRGEQPVAQPSGEGAEIAAALGPRGRPGRAIWRGLRDSYEHLWGVVSASVAWMAVLGTIGLGAVDGARRLIPASG